MAISASALASSSASGAGPYTTASQTPTDGGSMRLFLIFQVFGGGTLPTGCSVSGNGQTWSSVDSYTAVAGVMSVWLFTVNLTASSSSGALTITPSGDSSLKLCQWHCEEVTGQDTTTPYPQTVRATDGSANPQVATYSLSALGDATNNWTFAFTASGSLVTPSGTEIVDRSASDYYLEGQYSNPGSTSMTATAATAFQAQGGFAWEVAVASGGGGSAARLVGGILVNGILIGTLAG